MSAITYPGRIFHATDRSARCDRALARAGLLSSAWQSTLTVVHVLHPAEVETHAMPPLGKHEWHSAEPWNETVRRRLVDELVAEGLEAEVRVSIGDSADSLRETVDQAAAELVVLGIAKDAAMARIQLGSTVDNLVRHARVPVLSVRRRAKTRYAHVVVATDFSAPALQALRLAAHWFEGAHFTLFHAYSTAAASLDGVLADDTSRPRVEQMCADHLAMADLPPRVATSLEVLLEIGHPAALLADYVRSTNADLVVLGSRGRSGVARVLLGSTAEQLLHHLDCDTLVIR